MKITLVADLTYFDIYDQLVVLKAGTEVVLDERDSTACFNGDWFDIDKHEYHSAA